jgi:hypothetical protein
MEVAACAFLVVLLAMVFLSPCTKTLAEEKRELHAYFAKRDAADRRGERYPH